MSCYAHKEDPGRFVELFNRTVAPVVGRCRLGTHLCFGNFKARAVGLRRYSPMFPAFLDFTVDEIHVEMASREFSEIDIIAQIARQRDVAVGIIDVKSYYIESPEEVADRVRICLKHAPAERLAFAPDCGLSQTARWAAKVKLVNMVTGGGHRSRGARLVIKPATPGPRLPRSTRGTARARFAPVMVAWPERVPRRTRGTAPPLRSLLE
jgi:5-methyltetrahydropteroyltriglutamate--homocysteine methyltransferase